MLAPAMGAMAKSLNQQQLNTVSHKQLCSVHIIRHVPLIQCKACMFQAIALHEHQDSSLIASNCAICVFPNTCFVTLVQGMNVLDVSLA